MYSKEKECLCFLPCLCPSLVAAPAWGGSQGCPVCPAGVREHPGSCRRTPGASSGIPLPGSSASLHLWKIFTLKDLPVLPLALHPVSRCLQMFLSQQSLQAEGLPFSAGDQGAALSTGHRHSQKRGSMSQMAAQFPGAG